MWSFLVAQMSKYPESVFFDVERSISYAQIIDQVQIYAESLLSRLPKKSKCCILCDNEINTAIAILSCWNADMIAIPLSKNYGEKHCESIISLVQPDIVITDVNEGRAGLFTYNLTAETFHGKQTGTIIESELGDCAAILCTSGTTGVPKGAIITSKGLKNNVLAIIDYFQINCSDTILLARPLYHCAVLTGEFLVSIFKGLNIGFFNEKYNPSNLIDYSISSNVTVLCGTPTLFHHISLLAQRTQQKLPIKVIALSGECLTKDIAMQIRRTFLEAEIYHVYGLTEASPRVSYLPPGLFDSIPESVGVPLNNVKIRIINAESGNRQPVNTPGLVIVKSPSIMKGYYRNEEGTKQAVRNSWLNTSDIGVQDEYGNLFILSRADDMIIKAGMNIYPKEIEVAISTLPAIADVIAYGVPSKVGQEIAINVVLENGYEGTSVKELLKDINMILPAYQMPSHVHIVKELEHNSSGKRIKPILSPRLSNTYEYERKQLISIDIYEDCIRKLSQLAKPSVTIQNNFYYDDSENHLYSGGETLRIRQVEDKLTLEHKHGKKYSSGTRICKETVMLVGKLPKVIILGNIETKLVGSLLTQRTDFIINGLKISLDKSLYLGEIDYEIEIESDDCVEIPIYLSSIIEIAKKPSPGKYNRFVSCLKANNTVLNVSGC